MGVNKCLYDNNNNVQMNKNQHKRKADQEMYI